MQRRDFIRAVVGGTALAWPLPAHPQVPQRVAKVGILNLAPTLSEIGVKRGLSDLGYVEGRTIVFETRYADDRQDRLAELAADLIASGVDLIASSTTQAIQAVRTISPAIPVVMTATSDPIGSGLVASLSRPGGNTTGVTLLSSDVAGKRVELLTETIPDLRRVAVLAYRNHAPTALLFKETAMAAQLLAVELRLFEVDPAGLEAAFADMRRANTQAVVVQHPVAFLPHIPRIAALSSENRLPAIHEDRSFVAAGGLMSYGASVERLGRRAAMFVDKILKGARPADLPVEQPTRFDLVVNLKAARTLGVAIPPILLARADEVIE